VCNVFVEFAPCTNPGSVAHGYRVKQPLREVTYPNEQFSDFAGEELFLIHSVTIPQGMGFSG
jgi:hypothetical protein